MSFRPPASLAVEHQVEAFDCGNESLNLYLAAANVIGTRAVLVHAKAPEAAAFYSRFGFVPSPTDPLHLMLLIKDLRRTLEMPDK